MVIADKQNRIGIGASAQVMLPEKLEKMIESGKGLADAVADISGITSEWVSKELSTNGVYLQTVYTIEAENSVTLLYALQHRFISKLYD